MATLCVAQGDFRRLPERKKEREKKESVAFVQLPGIFAQLLFLERGSLLCCEAESVRDPQVPRDPPLSSPPPGFTFSPFSSAYLFCLSSCLSALPEALPPRTFAPVVPSAQKKSPVCCLDGFVFLPLGFAHM